MADTKISALGAAAALSSTHAFPVVQGGVTKKATLTETQLLDLMYPVGSVITYNIMQAMSQSGVTMPEVGANGGSFLAFDAAATEGCVFGLGSAMPRTWRTVDLYLETFNLAGDPASNNVVRWSVNVNSAGAATTDQTVTSALQQTIFKVGGQTYTLDAGTVNGVAKYGATVVIQRIGGNAADTFASDIQLSSLHAVRIT